MNSQYRYPGAKPFQTNESHVFYGRATVSEELYQLIGLEPLVVLHAKSGLGKSSVINAGLLPIVTKAQEYQPFDIRFHAYTDGKTDAPLEITRSSLQGQSTFLDKIRPEGDDSLWYHLKNFQLTNTSDQGILLVFDQFEELFTYDEKAIEDFARDLSEALYITLPQRYRDQRRAGFEKDETFLSTEELALLDQPLQLRILMAIRSDRMSLLKKIKAYFPTILSADFELQALNREQAEDAILSPAYQKAGFITPIFDYEDKAIEFLLDFLSEGGTEPIESFQLQILCEYVEQHLVEKQGQLLIEKQDIAQPDQILENYYLDKINAIADADDRLAARRLIEEGFIFEEEERRLTLYEGQIFKSYGISSVLLHQLLDTHLIRSEPSLRGGYTYELSHDTLVAPVLKAKAKRKAAERLAQEKADRQQREAELQALRKKEEAARQQAEKEEAARLQVEKAEAAQLQAEKEKQLRIIAESNEKRARQWASLAISVSILALCLSGLAFWFWKNAESVKKEQSETLGRLNETLAIVENEKAGASAARHSAEIRRIQAEFQTALAQENEQKALKAQAVTTQALRTAKIEKERAEAAAAAAQNTALVLTIAKKNPTLALRIAEYNLNKHPDNPAAVAAFREVMNESKNKHSKQTFEGHTAHVLAVAFSPNGKNILTGSRDNTAKLWDINGQQVKTFMGHDDAVFAVAFSPNGKNILTGSRDNTAKLWDINGQQVRTFKGHDDYVRTVAFSPNGKNILTGSYDNTAKLWDINGQELQTFEGHDSEVRAVAFSPDGKNILTGSYDKTAKLWDINGQEVRTLKGHDDAIYAVAFSPNGKNILTGGWDNTAKLWDINGLEVTPFIGHGDPVSAVAFSPDGKNILTGSYDQTAKLWNINGQELQTFKGHDFYVNAVAFSPDGKNILTGSWDNKAKLWLTPQAFLEERVHQFSLQELYDAGVILEAEDLEKIQK